MALFRSCGAKIEWVVTANGKKMPVDPDVVNYEDAEEGDVIISDGGNTYLITQTLIRMFGAEFHILQHAHRVIIGERNNGHNN